MLLPVLRAAIGTGPTVDNTKVVTVVEKGVAAATQLVLASTHLAGAI